MGYIRYIFLLLAAIPLLPLMIYQGKRIRKSVPKLPEAKEPQGIAKINVEEENLQVIFLGESTVAGVGAKTHQEGVAGSFAREMSTSLSRNVEWKVFARSGYNAHRVIKKLLPKMKGSEAHLIVIGLGGNDAFEFNPPWRWQKSIDQLIQRLKVAYPKAPIVFMNMPPIKEFPAFTRVIKFVIGNLVEIHGQFLRKEVEKHENVFYNDEVLTLKDWISILPKGMKKSDFFSDGVHPSTITYQIWGREMAKFILTKIPASVLTISESVAK